MAADDFSLVPTWVYPEEPEFHNIITPAESMKKQYQNLSATPWRRFRLVFKGLSDTNFWALYNHFYGRYGGYDSFSWQSVPSYIDTDQDGTPDGSNLTGRWVDKSFSFRPLANGWDAEVVFEVDV
jgi:hypothetical protein